MALHGGGSPARRRWTPARARAPSHGVHRGLERRRAPLRRSPRATVPARELDAGGPRHWNDAGTGRGRPIGGRQLRLVRKADTSLAKPSSVGSPVQQHRTDLRPGTRWPSGPRGWPIPPRCDFSFADRARRNQAIHAETCWTRVGAPAFTGMFRATRLPGEGFRDVPLRYRGAGWLARWAGGAGVAYSLALWLAVAVVVLALRIAGNVRSADSSHLFRSGKSTRRGWRSMSST